MLGFSIHRRLFNQGFGHPNGLLFASQTDMHISPRYIGLNGIRFSNIGKLLAKISFFVTLSFSYSQADELLKIDQNSCSVLSQVLGSNLTGSYESINNQISANKNQVIFFGEEHDQRSRFLFKAMIENLKQKNYSINCLMTEFTPELFDLPNQNQRLSPQNMDSIHKIFDRYKGEPEVTAFVDLIEYAHVNNIKVFMIDQPGERTMQSRNKFMANSIIRLHQKRICNKSIAILGRHHVTELSNDPDPVPKLVKAKNISARTVGFFNEKSRNFWGAIPDDDETDLSAPANPTIKNIEKTCSFKVNYGSGLKIVNSKKLNINNLPISNKSPTTFKLQSLDFGVFVSDEIRPNN